MLPDLTPDILAENRAWMKQVGALDDTDTFKSGPPASRHRRPPYWQRTALLE
jgi:hypothetical protein